VKENWNTREGATTGDVKSTSFGVSLVSTNRIIPVTRIVVAVIAHTKINAHAHVEWITERINTMDAAQTLNYRAFNLRRPLVLAIARDFDTRWIGELPICFDGTVKECVDYAESRGFKWLPDDNLLVEMSNESCVRGQGEGNAMAMPKRIWTPEEAKAFGAKGGKASGQARQPKPKELSNGNEVEPDSFLLQRLSRTRVALIHLEDRILEEASKPDADGQRLSWLATASDKLNNQEFDLAGRSKPKPGQGRAHRRPRSSHGPPPAA
jgi:hypothetical protein